MLNLAILIWCHYLGDFPLQGDFLSSQKTNYKYILFVHGVIWTGTVCAGLIYIGLFAWWKVIFLLLGHCLVDNWKCQHPKTKELGMRHLLWIDQLLHIIQIIQVCYL